MEIKGKIYKVLEYPYKNGAVWCELSIKTFLNEDYTIMIPTELYKTIDHSILKAGNLISADGIINETGYFMVANKKVEEIISPIPAKNLLYSLKTSRM